MGGVLWFSVFLDHLVSWLWFNQWKFQFAVYIFPIRLLGTRSESRNCIVDLVPGA
jgi:hypothetical protein